jgi:uncharacterized membrane protein
MLDDNVAAYAGGDGQSYGARVALIVRRVARVVAVPALLLMFGGLLLYGISSGWLLERLRVDLPGPNATSWLRSDDLLARLRSGEAAMGLGLLALALVPVMTVSLILLDHLRDRRWREAAVAASVVAIMVFSAILGEK